MGLHYQAGPAVLDLSSLDQRDWLALQDCQMDLVGKNLSRYPRYPRYTFRMKCSSFPYAKHRAWHVGKLLLSGCSGVPNSGFFAAPDQNDI